MLPLFSFVPERCLLCPEMHAKHLIFAGMEVVLLTFNFVCGCSFGILKLVFSYRRAVEIVESSNRAKLATESLDCTKGK